MDDPHTHDDDDLQALRAVRCARCAHVLTHEGNAIVIAGRHAHTFMNPSGVVFHVACFALADGCDVVDEPTTEFTWFPRTAWQFALCQSCRAHVGWAYLSLDDDAPHMRFFGLIEDALSR